MDIKVLTPILGLTTPERFIQIRWEDLQRARYRMHLIESITTRQDNPAMWSICRKGVNLAQRTWKRLTGEIRR